MELFVFICASLMVIGGALGVVVRSHPVHAALSLVLTLFGVAVLFVAQDAHFLAAVQVIVYAGAIVVLFLFVIMLLGVDASENLQVEPIPVQRPLAIVVGLGLLGILVTAIVQARDSVRSATGQGLDIPTESGDPDGNVRQIARSLFSDHVFAFELVSVLLVVAVVGTVLLFASSTEIGRDVIADVEPTTTWYLVLAAALFTIGTVGVMVRRNPLIMFMCVELMLNAVNLSFVALARRLGDIDGQTTVFFVLVVAAAEVVVGLGIIVAILRRRPNATADDLIELKG